jgi:hypothetical protein
MCNDWLCEGGPNSRMWYCPRNVLKISGLWHNCFVQIYSNIKCDLCMYILLVISWLVASFWCVTLLAGGVTAHVNIGHVKF